MKFRMEKNIEMKKKVQIWRKLFLQITLLAGVDHIKILEDKPKYLYKLNKLKNI